MSTLHKEIVHIFFHQKVQTLEGVKVLLSSNDGHIEEAFNVCMTALILKTEGSYEKHNQESLIERLHKTTSFSQHTLSVIINLWFKEEKDSQDLSVEAIAQWIHELL